ncbi:two-component system OmpR family sensor kinase [Hamadaea flava]|uniref:histidine kinase n=1 Tax=Hamadaea flava TaxID=1742688 RepID=A0ABV8LG36_9ACTN|nr:HAMP domain-containing sensor histidine kinase [Hamadaea flava]MCP2325933.1 two-component system OmpR family sensor kinase [Hamadaea flava]
MRLQRLRPRRWRQWTLRSRMVVAIVLMAGVALLVVNVAASSLIKSYLTDKLDEQLSKFGGNGGPGYGNSQNWGSNGSNGSTGGTNGTPIPPPLEEGRVVARYSEDGTRDSRGGFGAVDTTELPLLGDFAQIKARADGKPFTVDGTDGKYRVVVKNATMFDRSTGKDKTMYVLSAESLNKIDATANQMLLLGIGVSGAILLILAIGSAYVVKIGLRPLTRMENLATSIASADPPSGTAADSLVAGRVPDADPHTEAGRLGLALNTMLERIQSALAARAASEQKLRQFLADASHELRTPLTSIRGFAELYRRTGSQGGPEMSEMMSRIEHEAARMGLLVEDLLLLAALDEERPLRAQPVDLLAVAADTISDAHVRNPTRFVALTSFDPVTVIGDDHRLRQVATNLISNAVRHTPEHAKVEVRVAEENLAAVTSLPVATVGVTLPVGTRVAVLEVQDSGPGVPPQHAERIFERLYRADPGRSRAQGGSGLGLSIVAAIVAAHGGRVELYTSPGKGATFRVLLPLMDLPA